MRFLWLLLLFPLAACDAFGGGSREYDLSFFGTDGAFLARIEFDEPESIPCDGLGCHAADWRLTEGEPTGPVTIGEARGTLRAAPTAEGWSLDLIRGIDDGGTGVEIAVASDGRVTGTWTQTTIAGPMLGGTVEGEVE